MSAMRELLRQTPAAATPVSNLTLPAQSSPSVPFPNSLDSGRTILSLIRTPHGNAPARKCHD